MGSGVHGRRIAAAAALVLAAGACSDPASPTSAAGIDEGEVVALDTPVTVDDLDPDPALAARVPSGEVRIAWRPADEVEGARTQAADIDAPDGTEIVVVAWDLDVTATDAPGVSALAALGTDAEVDVVLVADGTDTELSSGAALTGGSALLAVPDPAALRAEITFDGVAQTVGPGADERDVPEQLAPLYDGVPAASATLECTPARLDATCLTDAAWLPWTDEGGWASDGSLWPVVRVEGQFRLGSDIARERTA